MCVIYTRVRERRRFPGKLIAGPGARWTPAAACDREHRRLFHPPLRSLSPRARRPCLDCAQLALPACAPADALCAYAVRTYLARCTQTYVLIYARAHTHARARGGRGRCRRAGSKRLVWPDKRHGGGSLHPVGSREIGHPRARRARCDVGQRGGIGGRLAFCPDRRFGRAGFFMAHVGEGDAA